MAFAVLATVTAPGWAQPIIIDQFTTNQAPLVLTFPPAGTSASSSVTGAGIVPAAGERDIQVNLTAGIIAGNTMSAAVSSGFFTYSQDATIAGNAVIQWDGTDGSATLNPTGLGGLDLTAGGGQNAFLMNTVFDDLPVNVVIQVFTDAGNSSSATLALPGLIFASTNFVVPYDSFTITTGTGADFTNVGAITMTVGSAVTAPDLVLDFFQTTSTVTASKTGALFIDGDGDGLAEPGDTIRYTIVINNIDDAGNAAATNVVFTNLAPLNTDLAVGSVTTTQGTITSGNGAGDTSVGVNVGTIADGGTVTITFDVVIDNPLPAGVTQIQCQGVVSADGLPNLPTDDPTGPGPDDPTVTPVTGTPAVTATKVDSLVVDGNGNGQVNPGDTVRYTMVITNTGNMNAAGVVLTNLVDPNAALVVGSVTTTQGTVTTGNNPGDTSVAVNIGTLLGAGGSVTVTFDVTIDNPLPPGVTQIACQGTVTGTNIPSTPTDDPDTPAPGDPTVTPITGTPAITAIKTDALQVDGNGNGQLDAGETIRYTIIITNTGDQAATGVVFTNLAPLNTDLVVGSVTTTQGTVTTGNVAGDTSVAVNVGTLPGAGGSVTITFDVIVDNPLAPGVTQITCQGNVTGTNIPTTPTDDPDFPGTTDPTVTPIAGAPPTVTAVKTDSLLLDGNGNGLFDPGDTIRYTIVITNTGSQTATGVNFTNLAPLNTDLVVGSVTTTQGTVTTGNTAGDTSVAVNIGSIPAAGSVTITFDVVIDNPLAPGVTQITCQGNVTGTNIPTTPTDDPAFPGTTDPTVTPIAGEGPDPLSEIPTLNEWGLLLLLAALAGLGLKKLRRQEA